jgi:curved DNA-binding protein
MAFVDFYEILGLDKNATIKDIKKSFRKLAHEFHPDRNSDNEGGAQKFQKINEAYSVLSDPDKKQKYDLYGEFWKVADELQKRKAKQNLSDPVDRRGFFKKLWRNDMC